MPPTREGRSQAGAAFCHAETWQSGLLHRAYPSKPPSSALRGAVASPDPRNLGSDPMCELKDLSLYV